MDEEKKENVRGYRWITQPSQEH